MLTTSVSPACGRGRVPVPGHDIITLGGSGGALEAIRQIVPGLPADLPPSLFVAVHQLPYATSNLPEILSRAGPGRCRHGTRPTAKPSARAPSTSRPPTTIS